MGRKGVSKRKPSKTKLKPFAGKIANGSVSSVMQGAESRPTSKVPSVWKKIPKNG